VAWHAVTIYLYVPKIAVRISDSYTEPSESQQPLQQVPAMRSGDHRVLTVPHEEDTPLRIVAISLIRFWKILRVLLKKYQRKCAANYGTV
jgi:hypothetical protein